MKIIRLSSLILLFLSLAGIPNYAYAQNSGQMNKMTLPKLSVTTNDAIRAVVSYVNKDSITAYISKLQGFKSRFTLNDSRYEISDWIFNKFKSFGYENVRIDEFPAYIGYNHIDSTYKLRNIVCTLDGYGASNEKFVMCGHYDSFSSNTNPLIEAPGADDNASGVAALLEIARVIKLNNYMPKRTLYFAALAGEELMATSYSGSKYFTEYLSEGKENIKLVVNHDMIGYNNKNLWESTVNINRHNDSRHNADLAILALSEYTMIKGNHEAYWGADLKPFYNAGYNGIYFEESIFNPNYHTNNDVIANMDLNYCREVVKGSCANILWASRMPNMVEGINASSDALIPGSVKFSWNQNHDFDFEKYAFYFSQNSGNSFAETITKDTSLTISGITDPSVIKYAVVARSSDGFESFGDVYDLNLTAVYEPDIEIPEGFYLDQNYPNPFNPSTIIKYGVPGTSRVNISVFDVLGQEVKSIDLGFQQGGNYQINFDARNLAGGVYFYRLTAGGFSIMRKMVVLK